ncbi:MULTISPECIES: hypothetical protein [unclassified Anabaena]|uniref:hypothetical protein n=1 Tax=unclassified Anabaena TaxID=2619674 RepID=UPI0014450EA1|nr:MULTISPECIES: hypothetical protein [unclassified Anabaena]MTJ09807.1 hypothetical protein [Anabaena sp. UHCC 0204]MTJ53368.1 hypothetical protein [Anabaena sp. UHCC 0253]
MRVWLVCFFVLFALAEFFKWLQAFSIPLPIYILGGAFLAVASNYDKIFGYSLSNVSLITALELPKLASAADSTAISLPISRSISVSVQESSEE